MPTCAVISCKARSEVSSVAKGGISFHRFPKKPDIRKQWIEITGRKDWIPTKSSTICSQHFNEDDFEVKNSKKRYLKNGAVPHVQIVYIEIVDPILTTFSTVTVMEESASQTIRDVDPVPLNSSTVLMEESVNQPINDMDSVPTNSSVMEECSSIAIQVEELIGRYISKEKSGGITKQRYSPALRTFALTLHYYSPKAYNYVRDTFKTCLPHVRTLRKWYKSVKGEPGFTDESFKALKAKSNSIKYPIIAGLMIDEMAIRRRIEWDGVKLHGHVEIGSGIEGDHITEAKEALVFLVTGINCNFKVSMGYFLIDGMTGVQRAELVKQCLEKIHETRVKIVSLTFDGCASNIAMLKHLGCNFEEGKMKFEDPVTKYPIMALLDPSHMVKLIRNTFQVYQVFVDENGKKIKWSYLEELNKLQEKEKFHLANKLRYRHIHYHNQKMKVKLATQLFSLSGQ
ncbi:unnamed protein product [Parnassius mnemosyne]|uniref:THAP-type domain-containing protein n=1 Tax=Parnassius mnemosyne TaxID=213953 RepID=A0AAV1MBX0_9NEOP